MILYNAGYKLLPKTTYIRVQTKQWTTFAEQKKPFAWVTDPYVLAGNDLPNDFRRSVGISETEEIMLRLFFMSLIAFIVWKLFFRKHGKENIRPCHKKCVNGRD